MGLDPLIDEALGFLMKEHKSAHISDGEYEIRNDSVRAVVFTKNTVPLVQSKMETHEKYMDIHLVIEGDELFGYSQEFSEETKYDPDEDIAFGSGIDEVFYRVKKGDFYIVWPGEAHRPLGRVPGGSEEVRKIVCKIKLNGKIQ